MHVLVYYIACTKTQTHTDVVETIIKRQTMSLMNKTLQELAACLQNICLRPTAIQSSEWRFFEHSKCSMHYLFIFFLASSLYSHVLPLHFIHRGTEQGSVVFKWWSESSLHSLSNYFPNDQLVRLLHLQEEKEKVRGGPFFHSFSCHSKITHSFLYTLPFFYLFFQVPHFKFSSPYSNGSNNLADWDQDVGREQMHCGPVSCLSALASFNRF